MKTMVVICTMKAGFVPNTPMKVLLEEYTFFLGNRMIIIPKGYAYDGLSIPQAYQWIVDMNQTKNIEAGLEHDFLYSKLAENICNRKRADMHLAGAVKTNFIFRNLVYLGVRTFGRFSYQKDSNYKKYEKEIKAYREKMWMRLSIS